MGSFVFDYFVEPSVGEDAMKLISVCYPSTTSWLYSCFNLLDQYKKVFTLRWAYACVFKPG